MDRRGPSFLMRRPRTQREVWDGMEPSRLRDLCRPALYDGNLVLNKLPAMEGRQSAQLAELVTTLDLLNTLDLTESKEFVLADINRVATALCRRPASLRVLRLKGVRLEDQGSRAIARIVLGQPNLEHLSLADTKIVGRWGNKPKGFLRLCQNLRSTGILSLDLSDNNLGRVYRQRRWKADIASIEFLGQILEGLQSLRELRLRQNALCGVTAYEYGPFDDTGGKANP